MGDFIRRLWNKRKIDIEIKKLLHVRESCDSFFHFRNAGQYCCLFSSSLSRKFKKASTALICSG